MLVETALLFQQGLAFLAQGDVSRVLGGVITSYSIHYTKLYEKLPKTQQEVLRLTRDAQVGQQIYLQLLNKVQELNIVKAGTVGNVRIIDGAELQPLPVKPKKSLLVVIATLLGGMLSVALVLVRAALNRSYNFV